MNILDIILLIPLAWGAYRGFRKGFIIELASLAALILGIYAAINFSYLIGDWLNENIDWKEKYLNIIAFILTFVIVIIVVHWTGKIIEKFIDILMLGFLNRILGLFFGIIKAGFIMSVLIFLINVFDDDQKLLTPKLTNESLLYSPVASFAPYIIPKLNLDKLDEYTKPIIEDLEN